MPTTEDVTLTGGTLIGGRYRIVRPIGGGGMGLVYEAEAVELGRRCAIKLVRSRGSLDAAARLRREAHAVAKLTHPNIVHVSDYVDDDQYGPALVMELLKGESLSERLARKGRLRVSEAVAIFGQVLDGLGAAHDAGMIHRDIKPSNIFLVALAGGQLVAKVLDFGIVRWVSPGDGLDLTRSTDWIGTPQYMAPEVLLHQPSDERADLHAIGCCLFQALSGRVPFEGENAIAIAHEVVNGKGIPYDALPTDVPMKLKDVIRTSTERDPAARYATTTDMRTALLSAIDRVADGEAPSPSAPQAPTPSTPLSTHSGSLELPRTRTWPVVGIVVAVALSVLAYAAFRPDEPASAETRHDVPPPTESEPLLTVLPEGSISGSLARPLSPPPEPPTSDVWIGAEPGPSAAPSGHDAAQEASGDERVPARSAPPAPSGSRSRGQPQRARTGSEADPGGAPAESAPAEAEPAQAEPAPRVGRDLLDPYGTP